MAGDVSVGTNGEAFPLMDAVDPTKGRNTISEWRRGLITSLLAPGFINNGIRTAKEGIIQHRSPVITAGPVYRFVDLEVQPRVSPGKGVNISYGSAVIVRGKSAGQTYEGAYILTLFSDIDLPMPDAPTTNKRIDSVYICLNDKNITADSAVSTSLQGPVVGYKTGTPNATVNLSGTRGTAGAPPAMDDGCLLLADIVRETNDNTITTEITDRRKSTSLRGAKRVLMAGDFDTDEGTYVGESVISPKAATRPQLEKVWDGAAWRGVAPYTLSAIPSFNTEQGLPRQIASVSVVDPGYPYRLVISGKTLAHFDPTAYSDGRFELRAHLDTTTSTNEVVLARVTRQWSVNAAQYSNAILNNDEFITSEGTGIYPATSASVLTGSHTVYLMADNEYGPGIYVAGGNASPWWNQLIVEVHPA